MADFNALEALINAHIKKNGVQAITGNILNGILRGMVAALGKGYTIAGSASPATDPGTMTGPLAYIAYTAGTYTHFGGLEVEQGEVAMLIYNEAVWHKEVLFSLAASATIDGNVGTPEVGVSFVDGLLTFDFRNMKGNPGNDGDAAGFGTINATVDGNVGTPGVSVQSSGPDTAKNISFQFTNLKGETGVTSVVATVDNTVGTPTCTVSLVGQQLTLAFSGLKGAQGDTGSSVDYPFTIVNNLTTNDATKGLSAAQGVVLDGKVSQLEAKVDDLLDVEERSLDISTTITPTSLGTSYYTDFQEKVMSANVTYNVTIKSASAIGQTNIDVMFNAAGSTSFNKRYRSGTTDLSGGVTTQITPTVDIYRIGVYQSGGTAGIPITITLPGGTEIISTRLNTIEEDIQDLQGDIQRIDDTLEEQIGEGEVKEQDMTCLGISFVRRATPIMLQGVPYTIKFKASADFGQSRWELWIAGVGVLNNITAVTLTNKLKLESYGTGVDLSQEQTIQYTPIWDVYAIGCGSVGTLSDNTPTVTYRIYREESQKFYDIDTEIQKLGDAVENDYFKMGACRCVDYGKVSNPAIGIITMGQSNADGRIPVADFPASVTLPDETVVPVSTSISRCQFIKGDNTTNYGANAVKTFSSYSNSGNWAFDQIVYNLVNNALGGEHDFFVVKQTMGGTPLLNDRADPATFYPDIAETGTKVAETFHAAILIRRAMELNPDIKWRCILYHQGETDNQNTSYDDYYTAFKNLIFYLRGVVGNPRLPFIFGTIPTNSAGYSVIVNDAQRRVAAEVNDVYIFDMGEADGFLTTDSTGMHFVASDAERLGVNMYEILRNAGGLKPYESPDA